MDILVYIQTVIACDCSACCRTVYLRLHPLTDGTSAGSSLTNRLREAKALHYQDFFGVDERDETDGVAPDRSGVQHEWAQLDKLRSAIVRSRKQRARRRLLIQIFLAVVVVGLILAGTANWLNS